MLRRKLLVHFRSLVIAFCVILPAMLAIGNFLMPLNPAYQATEEYQKKAYFSFRLPFVHSYYLLTPLDYDPDDEYPLVLVLHGASKRSVAPMALASEEIRPEHPAFVLMPMAPFRQTWAVPSIGNFRTGKAKALPHAIDVLEAVIRRYPVDEDRIYIVGHSTGGFGTFGAVKRYPDIFAAAISSAGGWDPGEAVELTEVPIWAFHSKDDPQVPVKYSRDTVEEINAYGGDAKYTEFEDLGHGSAPHAFGRTGPWDWLFGHSR